MKPADIEALARVLPSVRVKGVCPRGKRMIGSREAALAEAERMNAQPLRRGPNVPANAFRCRLCGGWHIGRWSK